MTEGREWTSGPWWVRKREVNGELVDCFVAAKDVNGFHYDACILADDEYRDGTDRKLADCHLIAAAPDLYDALALIVEKLDLAFPPNDEKPESPMTIARAALAKARGA